MALQLLPGATTRIGEAQHGVAALPCCQLVLPCSPSRNAAQPAPRPRAGPARRPAGLFARRVTTVAPFRPRSLSFEGGDAAAASLSGALEPASPSDTDADEVVASAPDADKDKVDQDGGAWRGVLDGVATGVLTFCGWYSRHVERAPVRTKALTSLVGFIVGDLVAQTLTTGGFDIARCLRLGLYGFMLDGPVGHLWYQQLDARVSPNEPQAPRTILAKTALDQLIWAPAMTVVFFVFLRLLEGRPDAIMTSVQTQVVPTLLANYLVWPVAHYISFRFLPTDYRILYNNVISILWITWLSLLANGDIDMHAFSLPDAATLQSVVASLSEHTAALGELLRGLPAGAQAGGVLAQQAGVSGSLTQSVQGFQMLSYGQLLELSAARMAGVPPGPWSGPGF